MAFEDEMIPGMPTPRKRFADGRGGSSGGQPHGGPYFLRAIGLSVGLGLLATAVVTGLWRCPTAVLFHVPCPACGTTRAARAILAGDLRGAAIQPLAPLVFLLLGVLGARSVWFVLWRGDAGGALEGRAGRALVASIVVLALAEVALWGLRWAGMFGGPVPV
jgi:hypothetical protein